MSDVTLAPVPSIPLTTLLGDYAHLRREESLLVTDWERVAPDVFALGVRWPAVPGELPYDPRILAQTIRQSGLVVAHAAYGVPLTHHTVLSTLDVTVAPGLRIPRDRPRPLEVRVTVARTGSGRRAASSLHMNFHILLGGATAARSVAEFGWISPAAYRRLRGPHLTVDWGAWPLPAPIDPVSAGRARAADVVLAPGDRPNLWLLRNDIGNHLLFDHPVDHVPGLALLEAAEQAAQALLPRAPFTTSRVVAAYHRYVEFDRPCWIEAERLPPAGPDECAVRVTGFQSGEPVFGVELSGVNR